MIEQTYSDIVTDELIKGAIWNFEFPGFAQDYAVLHCLLRKYKPKSVFEIGTNYGSGTQIIKNAVPEAEVYSLDLPFEEMHESLKPGGKDMVGSNCKLPFTQLRGDSLLFKYAEFICDSYFIDGEHDFEHLAYEALNILMYCKPKLIVFHDSDITEVMRGIEFGFEPSNEKYDLYRVTDTRIAYLLRK